jgi:hypothetical protein
MKRECKSAMTSIPVLLLEAFDQKLTQRNRNQPQRKPLKSSYFNQLWLSSNNTLHYFQIKFTLSSILLMEIYGSI